MMATLVFISLIFEGFSELSASSLLLCPDFIALDGLSQSLQMYLRMSLLLVMTALACHSDGILLLCKKLFTGEF